MITEYVGRGAVTLIIPLVTALTPILWFVYSYNEWYTWFLYIQCHPLNKSFVPINKTNFMPQKMDVSRRKEMRNCILWTLSPNESGGINNENIWLCWWKPQDKKLLEEFSWNEHPGRWNFWQDTSHKGLSISAVLRKKKIKQTNVVFTEKMKKEHSLSLIHI